MNTETVKKMGDMRLYGMQTAFKHLWSYHHPLALQMMRWRNI